MITAIVCLQGELTSLQVLDMEAADFITDETLPMSTLNMYERELNEGLRNVDKCWMNNIPFVT